MAVYQERIPLVDNASYIARSYGLPIIDFPYHAHPEYELNYVSNIRGSRHVGDHKEDIEHEDLVLTGPYLPHQWKCAFGKSGNTRQLTVQMSHTFPGKDFLERPEAKKIKDLLNRSSRGIVFEGKVVGETERLIHKLLKTSDFKGMMVLLEILHTLSEWKSYRILSSTTYLPEREAFSRNEKTDILYYMLQHFRENVSLQSVAKQYNMSESAFAHFIRKKTGKSFTSLLNEMRIGYACRQLIDTDKNIAEVCFECGYNNISYFNRKFRELKTRSPKTFRKEYRKNEA
jgi:AraC-like DNA-binding protein